MVLLAFIARHYYLVFCLLVYFLSLLYRIEALGRLGHCLFYFSLNFPSLEQGLTHNKQSNEQIVGGHLLFPLAESQKKSRVTSPAWYLPIHK